MSPAMQKNRGFTLIELMITVAIIAILAAIAFPAFDSQTRKSNRAAAQAQRLDLAGREAQYLVSARQYTATLTDMGYTTPTEMSKWYGNPVITVDNTATPPTFTITATPIAGSKQAKDGPLVLKSDGTKTRNGDPAQW